MSFPSNNNQGEDPLITKVQVGVSHLQSILSQVHNLSTAGSNNQQSIGSEINDVLNAVDQIRQDRDATQYEISHLRQENAAVHQTLRALLRIIERFSSVHDPVVASDGYTYERKDILKYFDDCKRTSTTARSHLTSEDLKEDLVIPNYSMKRMLTLLQEVDVPMIIASSNGMNRQHRHSTGNNSTIPNASSSSNTNGTSPTSTPGTNNAAIVAPTLHSAGRITPQQSQLISPNSSSSGGVQQQPSFGNFASGNPIADSINNNSNHLFQNNNTNSPGAMFNRDRRRSSAATDLSGGKNSSRGSRRQSLQSPTQLSGKLHPCLRVYGRCKFDDECVFASYPYECCLSHLKGKCRFGNTCLEPHVEFHGGESSSQSQGLRSSGSDVQQNNNSTSNSRRQSLQQTH